MEMPSLSLLAGTSVRFSLPYRPNPSKFGAMCHVPHDSFRPPRVALRVFPLATPVMICAPAVKRRAVRVGVRGGTTESVERRAQIITRSERQTRSLCWGSSRRQHSLPAAQPHQKASPSASVRDAKLPLWFELGYRSKHELVEQWNRKRHVSVGWTVDHSFFHQLGANWSEAGDFYPQGTSDISRALGTRTEFGHRPQEIPFAGRQAVKSDTKKILIQPGDD